MIYNHLRKILPPITDPVVIEIGAHIGTDTEKIIELLRKPYQYYAFEPDARDVKRLLEAQAKIGFFTFPWAVGDIDGIVPFYLSDGITGKGKGRQFTDASSLKRPKGNTVARPWMRFEEVVEVRCIKLDTFCKNIPHIDFIWADIQGAELEMIEGGKETLKKTRYLYTECQEGMYHGQPGFEKIKEALPGWDVVFRTKTDVLLRNNDNKL